MSQQIYWGAWIGNSHIGNYGLLTQFESQVGKGVSIWDWIQIWTRPQDSENVPTFDVTLMNQCRTHGAIPMVSWSPEQNAASQTNQAGMFYNLQSILNGNFDAYLDAWGQASATWGHPYFLRLMWEFTGGWTAASNNGYGIYPWDSAYGNTPAIFVSSWKYIVNRVRNAGGTNITWVWCTGDVGDSVSTLQSVYPGDNYVDWVGTDVYGDMRQGDSELNNIHAAIPQKPVMIPEIGYGSGNGAYWNTLLTNILPNQYPWIKAVVIWEMPSAGLTVVDSGTLSSFKQAIASNYYSANTFSAITSTPILPLGNAQKYTLNILTGVI